MGAVGREIKEIPFADLKPMIATQQRFEKKKSSNVELYEYIKKLIGEGEKERQTILARCKDEGFAKNASHEALILMSDKDNPDRILEQFRKQGSKQHWFKLWEPEPDRK